MLLVMETAGIFQSNDGKSQLWNFTWDRIDAFLPGLRNEVFKSQQTVESKAKGPEESAEASDPPGAVLPSSTEDGTAEAPTEPKIEKSPEKQTEEHVSQFVASDMFTHPSPSILLQPPLPNAAMARHVGIPIAAGHLPTSSILSSAIPTLSSSPPSTVPLILNPNIGNETGLPLSHTITDGSLQ